MMNDVIARIERSMEELDLLIDNEPDILARLELIQRRIDLREELDTVQLGVNQVT